MLIAGAGLLGLGALLLADAGAGFDLRLGVLIPVICALLGAVLLAAGLGRRP